MNRLILTGLVTAALAAFSTQVSAHGGVYRGPGDVVPPRGDGGGGSSPGNPNGPDTPRPGFPGSPTPGDPSTGSPRGPVTGPPRPSGGGNGGGSTTGGGMPIGDDLTRWEFWWEFNKDPYIRLRDAIHAERPITGTDDFFMGSVPLSEGTSSLKPTATTIRNDILPRLRRALESTDQRDITSSCLIALGKIGEEHPEFDVLDLMRSRLRVADLEVRQSAALSMGISQMTEAVDDLLAIALDTARGRDLCARRDVDDATRSFAAYGAGLVAWASTDADVKRRVFDELAKIVRDDRISDRNIRVAAIHGIGLLRPTDDAKGRDLLAQCYELLVEGYWQKKTGAGEQLIQSHVPTAMAKLLEACPDPKLNLRLQDEMVRTLRGKTAFKRTRAQITQSAALALGQLATPADTYACEALLQYFKRGKDKQTKYFALIALGQIGGADNRDALLDVLRTGTKALVKPWASLALGVLCFEQREDDPEQAVDSLVGRRIEHWLHEVRNPDALGAFAISLGLVGYTDSADTLRALLERHKSKDTLAGHLCVSLALMQDTAAIDPIIDLVETSSRRPERLRQAAIALGKLGDHRVARVLADQLERGDTNLARMSAIASALGHIGDSRTVAPLADMLFDDSLTALTRAFAAVALGGVADKESLPWNSKLSRNINYRAAVETLTNQSTGILDIL